ncbi:MAG TPA: hypothetical protein DD408_12090, partial [Rheinheimera sp.]|nr:hypothetical protein [Rheinheimera sp.]
SALIDVCFAVLLQPDMPIAHNVRSKRVVCCFMLLPLVCSGTYLNSFKTKQQDLSDRFADLSARHFPLQCCAIFNAIFENLLCELSG